jgi:hypothetical protein
VGRLERCWRAGLADNCMQRCTGMQSTASRPCRANSVDTAGTAAEPLSAQAVLLAHLNFDPGLADVPSLADVEGGDGAALGRRSALPLCTAKMQKERQRAEEWGDQHWRRRGRRRRRQAQRRMPLAVPARAAQCITAAASATPTFKRLHPGRENHHSLLHAPPGAPRRVLLLLLGRVGGVPVVAVLCLEHLQARHGTAWWGQGQGGGRQMQARAIRSLCAL